MTGLKTLALLIAALGMALVERGRSAPDKDDDGVGLFVGSARPLPATQPVRRRGR